MGWCSSPTAHPEWQVGLRLYCELPERKSRDLNVPKPGPTCPFLPNTAPCPRQEQLPAGAGDLTFSGCARTSPAGPAFPEFWCCWTQLTRRGSGSPLGKSWWLKRGSKKTIKGKNYDEQGRGIIFKDCLFVYLCMQINNSFSYLDSFACIYTYIHKIHLSLFKSWKRM